MNKERRESLLDVTATLSEAMDRLGEIRDEEQEAFDNMPEGLQCSARGDSMQNAIDTMDDWCDQIDGLINKIETEGRFL